MNELQDQISTELDRRKIQRLIDEGIITFRELCEAEVIDRTEQ